MSYTHRGSCVQNDHGLQDTRNKNVEIDEKLVKGETELGDDARESEWCGSGVGVGGGRVDVLRR